MSQVLLLAAGCSRRFNGTKQLAKIGKHSLINTSLLPFYDDDKMIQGINGLTVVLGYQAEQIQSQLPQFVNSLILQNWQKGMGSNLSHAVSLLPNKAEYVLVCLADQIALKQSSIIELLKLSKRYPSKIVAAKYNNIVGVPAIFPKAYFQDLIQLSGDKGARQLLKNKAAQVVTVDMPEAAIDIDTQAELEHYLNSLG